MHIYVNGLRLFNLCFQTLQIYTKVWGIFYRSGMEDIAGYSLVLEEFCEHPQRSIPELRGRHFEILIECQKRYGGRSVLGIILDCRRGEEGKKVLLKKQGKRKPWMLPESKNTKNCSFRVKEMSVKIPSISATLLEGLPQG